jgi:hypothetical protein
MYHLHIKLMPPHALPQLQDTPGITRYDQLGLHRQQMFHFAFEQSLRRLYMDEIVGPSAATAPIAFRHIQQFQLRNLPQERTRLFADPLSMQQMTRVVIRRSHWHRVEQAA